MKTILLLFLITTFLACNNITSEPPFENDQPTINQPKQSSVIFLDHLSVEYESIVRDVVTDYAYMYNQVFNIKLLIGTKENGCVVRKFGQLTETVLATAKKDTIFFCMNAQGGNKQHFRNTIVHELFHTLEPSENLSVAKYRLDESSIVFAYKGLCIAAVKKDGTSTYFRLFEEAAAEACASYATDFHYDVASVKYSNIGAYLIKAVAAKKFTYIDLINFQKESDVVGFVGKLVSKPRDKVMPNDIENTMKIFNNLYAENTMK